MITLSSGGTDTGVGSANDGDFGGYNLSATNMNSQARAKQQFSRNHMTQIELGISINTAYAAASTNTITADVGITFGTAATPADAIVTTITANATGLFSNTGSTDIPENSYIMFLHNSDDATDPAAIGAGYGVFILG